MEEKKYYCLACGAECVKGEDGFHYCPNDPESSNQN